MLVKQFTMDTFFLSLAHLRRLQAKTKVIDGKNSAFSTILSIQDFEKFCILRFKIFWDDHLAGLGGSFSHNKF